MHFFPNQDLSSININSLGFRGPEITPDKPNDTYRIFVVGGSTIYGAASQSDKTTIPGYLQEMFDKESFDLNIEVINAGISSAYSFSESFYIKETILNLEPDLLIMYNGGNDAIERHLDSSLNTNPNEASEFVKTLLKIGEYRTPFFLLGKVFYQAAEPAPIDNEIKTQIITLWKNRWAETCEMAKNEGVSTLITVQPMLGTGIKEIFPDEKKFAPDDEFELGALEILEGMATSLTELNSKCDITYDLRGAFDDIKNPLYFDHIHISDEGHEIIAKQLFDLSLPIVRNDING